MIVAEPERGRGGRRLEIRRNTGLQCRVKRQRAEQREREKGEERRGEERGRVAITLKPSPLGATDIFTIFLMMTRVLASPPRTWRATILPCDVGIPSFSLSYFFNVLSQYKVVKLVRV